MNCELSAWSGWTTCSKTLASHCAECTCFIWFACRCGKGQQSRTRTVAKEACDSSPPQSDISTHSAARLVVCRLCREAWPAWEVQKLRGFRDQRIGFSAFCLFQLSNANPKVLVPFRAVSFSSREPRLCLFPKVTFVQSQQGVKRLAISSTVCWVSGSQLRWR